MNSSIDWLLIVRITAILGTFQGLILFGLLFQKRKNISNFYLSLFLLSFSIFIATYADPTLELYLRHPYIPVLADFLPFFQTPMVYFYFYHTIYKNSRPRIPVFIHMIPAVVDIILVHTWFFLTDQQAFRAILYQSFFHSPHPWVWISSLGKYTSGIFYSFLILRMIYRSVKKPPARPMSPSQRKWLWAGATAHAFCWFLVLVTGVIVSIFTMDQLIVKVFILFELVSFTVTMYLIAFFAFRYPSLFPEEKAREKIARKLNLDEKKIIWLEESLDNLMAKKKYYLEETASLRSTAKRLGIHANVLSYLVNEKFGKNFNEYINDLRLDHFMELAKNESETTILRMAFDSGFASKTTFNRTFKRRFNMVPGEFLARAQSVDQDN